MGPSSEEAHWVVLNQRVLVLLESDDDESAPDLADTAVLACLGALAAESIGGFLDLRR